VRRELGLELQTVQVRQVNIQDEARRRVHSSRTQKIMGARKRPNEETSGRQQIFQTAADIRLVVDHEDDARGAWLESRTFPRLPCV
jgi:hypothetical protein